MTSRSLTPLITLAIALYALPALAQPKAAPPAQDALQENFIAEHEIGRRFSIDPAQLPAPKSSPIVTNRSLTLPVEGHVPQVPAGFTATPAVVVNGKRYRFAAIPGHYWKVLNKRGYAIGLHFQTDKPFPWAKNIAKGKLLYMIYAIPGTCGDGNYAKAIKAPNATIQGRVPPGFDHWHAFQGGGSKVGTWYTHIPVRDFTFAGPAGNPFEGKKIFAGSPKFLPVCDIVK